MDLEHIKELIKQVNDSNIDEFSFKQNSTEIFIKKNSETVVTTTPVKVVSEPVVAAKPVEVQPVVVKEEVQVSAPKVQEENLHKITSPMVGTFYASSSPDADKYVNKGSKVNKNTVVCIVEAMKLFNEIEAEVKGEIVEVLVESGQLVEYGQPLFLVRPEVGGN